MATKIVISLAKHPTENRTLMCWYQTKIAGKKIQFRSDHFVPAEIEDKLHKLHCQRMSSKQLIDGCIKLMEPYLGTLESEVKDYLKMDSIQRMIDIDYFQL